MERERRQTDRKGRLDLGHAGQAGGRREIWHLVPITLRIPLFNIYSHSRRDQGRGVPFPGRAPWSRERGRSSGGHATETVKKNEWGKNTRKIKMKAMMRVTEPSAKHEAIISRRWLSPLTLS